MSEISRTMSFDSSIEWMEVMCDLMCGSIEEEPYEEDDGDLVDDTEETDY